MQLSPDALILPTLANLKTAEKIAYQLRAIMALRHEAGDAYNMAFIYTRFQEILNLYGDIVIANRSGDKLFFDRFAIKKRSSREMTAHGPEINTFVMIPNRMYLRAVEILNHCNQYRLSNRTSNSKCDAVVVLITRFFECFSHQDYACQKKFIQFSTEASGVLRMLLRSFGDNRKPKYTDEYVDQLTTSLESANHSETTLKNFTRQSKRGNLLTYLAATVLEWLAR